MARTAFSSDSQTDSWPDDSPSARSSANSLIRSRAETDALTTKPTIAKRAAATNPMPERADDPEGDRVGRERPMPADLRQHLAAQERRAVQGLGDCVDRPVRDGQPPFVGWLDGAAVLEPQQRQRGQIHDGDGSAGIRRRERADAGRDPDIAPDPADRQADSSSPTLLAVASRSASLATIGIGAPASSAIGPGANRSSVPPPNRSSPEQRRDPRLADFRDERRTAEVRLDTVRGPAEVGDSAAPPVRQLERDRQPRRGIGSVGACEVADGDRRVRAPGIARGS